MGISTGDSKKGPIANINVTPMVDVVLVLLIIFLVTTPIMMHQITVEVPRKLSEIEDPTIASKQLTAFICFNGKAIISDGRDYTERIDPGLPPLARFGPFQKKLKEVLEDKKTEKVVFVDFEDDVPYGEAVSAMDMVRGAGAEKVALKVRDESAEAVRAAAATPGGGNPLCTAEAVAPAE